VRVGVGRLVDVEAQGWSDGLVSSPHFKNRCRKKCRYFCQHDLWQTNELTRVISRISLEISLIFGWLVRGFSASFFVHSLRILLRSSQLIKRIPTAHFRCPVRIFFLNQSTHLTYSIRDVKFCQKKGGKISGLCIFKLLRTAFLVQVIGLQCNFNKISLNLKGKQA